MLIYLTKRLLSIIPVLLGITLVSFLIGVISPGDPAYLALTRDGITEPSEIEIREKRVELGLNQPLMVQYKNWVWRVVKGDLGTSIYSDEDIAQEIRRRFPITLKLSSMALLIAVVCGLGTGSIMTKFRGRFVDRFLRGCCSLIVSVPSFWMAILLITIFAERLKVLPTSGYDGLYSLILPSIVLALGSVGVSARLSRANFIGELSKPYALFAEAKGLTSLNLGVTHIFRNALIPIITFFGMYYAGILGGTSVIETIFALPGLGSYVIEGVFNRDYFVVQSYVLITGTIYVTMTLVIDLLYFLINPRIKQGEGI